MKKLKPEETIKKNERPIVKPALKLASTGVEEPAACPAPADTTFGTTPEEIREAAQASIPTIMPLNKRTAMVAYRYRNNARNDVPVRSFNPTPSPGYGQDDAVLTKQLPYGKAELAALADKLRADFLYLADNPFHRSYDDHGSMVARIERSMVDTETYLKRTRGAISNHLTAFLHQTQNQSKFNLGINDALYEVPIYGLITDLYLLYNIGFRYKSLYYPMDSARVYGPLRKWTDSAKSRRGCEPLTVGEMLNISSIIRTAANGLTTISCWDSIHQRASEDIKRRLLEMYRFLLHSVRTNSLDLEELHRFLTGMHNDYNAIVDSVRSSTSALMKEFAKVDWENFSELSDDVALLLSIKNPNSSYVDGACEEQPW